MTTTTSDMMTLDEAIAYAIARADGGALDGGGHKHAAGCQGFAAPIHEPWS